MATEQYHEPAEQLSQTTRTFARMITGLIEEAEAIGWYEQRLSLEKDAAARAIMEDAQKEEFKLFSMDREFLLRRKIGEKSSGESSWSPETSSRTPKRQKRPRISRGPQLTNWRCRRSARCVATG